MGFPNGSNSHCVDAQDTHQYHCIIFNPLNESILALRQSEKVLRLPCISLLASEVDGWEHNCNVLSNMVEEEFGVKCFILGSLWRNGNHCTPDTIEEVVLVIEMIRRAEAKGSRRIAWIAKENLGKTWKPLGTDTKVEERLSSYFSSDGLTSADSGYPVWRTMGWFHQVKGWICDVLSNRGFLVEGITQVQNTENSGVLRVDAIVRDTKPKSVKQHKQFFVKTCEERSREAIITSKLASFAADIIPEVVAIHEHWNAFMQYDAGAIHYTPDPVSLLEGVGVLQRRSISHLKELEALGMQVHDIKWVIANMEKTLRRTLTQSCEEDADSDFLQERISVIQCLLQELDAQGLPTTIVHGDLHLGNIARQRLDTCTIRRYNIFDWGSAWLGHPLLDVHVLLESIDQDTYLDERPLGHYLRDWGWPMTIPSLKRLIEIAGLCYWIIDLYYATRDHLEIQAGDVQLARSARGILNMSLTIEKS